MVTLSVWLVGLFTASLAPGQGTAPQELEVLKTKFQVAHEKLAAEAKAAVAEFDRRYLAQLEKVKGAAERAGNLEEALAAKAEMETFRTRPPASKDASPFREIARLQAIYDKEKRKLDDGWEAKLKPLLNIYRKQLKDLTVKLTKAGDLDGAVACDAELKRIDSGDYSNSLGIQSHRPISGRYVRLDLKGEGRHIQVAELQIFNRDGVNIARKGKASQSDNEIHHRGAAHNAIDGNTDGDINRNTISFNKDDDPWWEVDLRDEHEIDRIVFWSRSWFQSRMDGFKLSVLDENRKTVWEQTVPKAPEKSQSFDLSPGAPN